MVTCIIYLLGQYKAPCHKKTKVEGGQKNRKNPPEDEKVRHRYTINVLDCIQDNITRDAPKGHLIPNVIVKEEGIWSPKDAKKLSLHRTKSAGMISSQNIALYNSSKQPSEQLCAVQ